MDRSEALLHWRTVLLRKRVAAEHALLQEHDWSFAPPARALHALRPDGLLARYLFHPIELGQEIGERVVLVFSCCYDDDGERLRVVVPPPCTRHDVTGWLLAHFESMRDLAALAAREGIGPADAADRLREPPRIRFVQRIRRPPPAGSVAPLRALLEELIRLPARLPSASEHTTWMRGPVYALTADHALASWMLWPHNRESTRLRDPFAAHFELWRHGIELEPRDDQTVDVVLPGEE